MKKDQTRFLLIGIDTGVNTGVAVYNTIKSEFEHIGTYKILEAMEVVKNYSYMAKLVVVEDARQVKYGTSKYKAQGAGSVKRDCQIWEDFLQMNNISSRFVRPNKKITKWTDDLFKRVTGYKGRTNEHNRDAAMLIYNLKGII